MLKINTKAPNFKLPSTSNSIFELKKVKNKNIILYFYPKDDTPGCTIESKDFSKLNNLITFYKELYPTAEISICSCLESESMKIFCNCYYSVKVQFFTEIYQLCQKNNCDYEKVKDMMIKNNWINPMHTTIPGPDGQISYGGLCFPKDTNALLKYMEKMNTPHEVLEGTINERNEMRTDKDNCI